MIRRHLEREFIIRTERKRNGGNIIVVPPPSPPPPPIDYENVANVSAGAADYTAANATQLANVMSAALTAMAGQSDRPKKIALTGNIGSWFPSSLAYPSQLSIVSDNPDNPRQLNRVGMSGLSNIVFDNVGLTYKPSGDTFPPALAITNCSNITIRNMRMNLAGNDANTGAPLDPTTGRGRAIQVTGGSDVTFYRLGIPSAGGGNNNYMVLVQHEASTSNPCVRPRFIECALQNGKGGDGFRILGISDGYFARNLVENTTKASANDHSDAMQITWDANPCPNSLTVIDHLHWGATGNNAFEGLQCTNTPSSSRNGPIVVKRLKTIGSEVSGLSMFGTDTYIMEDCELYMIDYGVAGAQAPKVFVRNAYNVEFRGTNLIAGNIAVSTDAGWPPSSIVRNDGITIPATITTGTRDQIVAAWKVANPNVPFV